MNCLILFFTFAKFGVLCFGGGYMLIPLMIAEFVGQGKLLQAEQFGNLVSVSQLTPGPVGINVATFIGCIDGGVAGALAGTLGLVFPTLLLAGVAVSLIRRYQETAFLQGLPCFRPGQIFHRQAAGRGQHQGRRKALSAYPHPARTGPAPILIGSGALYSAHLQVLPGKVPLHCEDSLCFH